MKTSAPVLFTGKIVFAQTLKGSLSQLKIIFSIDGSLYSYFPLEIFRRTRYTYRVRKC